VGGGTAAGRAARRRRATGLAGTGAEAATAMAMAPRKGSRHDSGRAAGLSTASASTATKTGWTGADLFTLEV